MPRIAPEDADLHLAAETLQTVSIGSYEFGVSVMDVEARRRLCAMFAEKVIEGIARGERLDQARFLVIEGVPQHLPQPACFQSGAFNFSTEVVDTRPKGVGGRLVYSARVTKNGPLRQRISSVVSVRAKQS